MKKKLILIALLLFSIRVLAQQRLLSGIITDYAGNAVPFTSVYVNGTSTGTSANVNGQYTLKLKAGKYQLCFRSLGFSQDVENIEITSNKTLNIRLHAEQYRLAAVNADSAELALSIIKNAISKRREYLLETASFSAKVYIKGMQRLVHAPQTVLGKAVTKQFDVDTTANNILYMAELQTQFNFKQPNKVKEVVLSVKQAGVNNAFVFNRAANLQMNLYKNTFDIEGLNQRNLVSPVADDALEFYQYKLLGTAVEDGNIIDKIQVIPKHKHGPVFNGYIYIVDGEWRIYSAHLYVTKNANLNYVDTLNVNQQYLQIAHNKWQPASVTITYSGSTLGFKYNGYISGTFSDYNLTPKFGEHFFNGEIMRLMPPGVNHDSLFWAQNRPTPLTAEERRNYAAKDAVKRVEETDTYQDSVQTARNKFSLLRYTLLGDSIKNRSNRSSLFFHPMYETVLFNTVEGFGIDLKVDYDKRVGAKKSFTISPEARYGFSSNLWSANVGFQYRYNPYARAVFYGKVGSSVLDLNNEINNAPILNSISTLFFKSNSMKLYRSKYAILGMQHNLLRGLLLDGGFEYAQREQLYNSTNYSVVNKPDVPYTSNNPLHPNLPDTALLFRTSNALTLKASLTYTFDEQFTGTPDGVYYEQSRRPKIKLSYRKGINNVLKSDVDYDYADAQVYQDHIRIGHIGYSSFVVATGKFFNTAAMVYPDFKKFKGNEGLTFTPLVSYFHFLPYYTSYTTDSFFEAHYEHNFSGYLFNKVAGLRSLKLEEIAGAAYLSRPNTPGYTEYYIGIKRYVFRIDYSAAFSGGKLFKQGIVMYFGF